MKTQREVGYVKIVAELGVLLPEPRNIWSYQKPEEARKDPCLEASEAA